MKGISLEKIKGKNIIPFLGFVLTGIIFVGLVFAVVKEFNRASKYESSLKNITPRLQKIDAQAIPGVDLAVSINDNQNSVSPNQIQTYSVDISNLGTENVKNVLISLSYPANSVFVTDTSTTGWVCEEVKCDFTIENLDSLLTQNLAISFRTPLVLTADQTQYSLAVSVTDDGSNGEDVDLTNNSFTDTNSIIAFPQIKLEQSTTSDNYVEGSIIVYKLDFSNIGSREAQNVKINAKVPEFTTFDSQNSTPNWSCLEGNPAGTECVFSLDSVLAEGNGSVSFAVGINSSPQPMVPVTQIVNTVSINNGDKIKDDTNFPAINPSDLVTSISSPNLVVTKEFEGSTFGPNDSIKVKVKLQNTGNSNSYEVVVRDNSLVGTKFSNVMPVTTPTGFTANVSSIDGNEVISFTANQGIFIAPSENLTFEYTAKILNNFNDGESFVSYVNVTGSSLEGNISGKRVQGPISTAATLVFGKPELGITISNNVTTVKPGKNTSYVITITNSGHIAATNILVKEQIPSYSTLNLGNNPGWSCDGIDCTYSIASLAAGESVSVSLNLQISYPIPNSVQTFTNIVQVNDDEVHGPDSDFSNNIASDTDKIAVVFFP